VFKYCDENWPTKITLTAKQSTAGQNMHYVRILTLYYCSIILAIIIKFVNFASG